MPKFVYPWFQKENLLSGLDWHQLADYVASYNQVRPHQSLDYKTPDESYKENIKCEQLLQSLDSIIGSNNGGKLSQMQPIFLY